MNDKYIINDDYHGDVKLVRIDKSKKVNLSKPTDNYVKPINNLSPVIKHGNNPICLTKPEDVKVQKNIEDVEKLFNDGIKRQQKIHSNMLLSNMILPLSIMILIVLLLIKPIFLIKLIQTLGAFLPFILGVWLIFKANGG